MGFHGTSKAQNIHVIHRWEAADITERQAISTNPDGTAITATNGLHCLCLQLDTGKYWRLSAYDPSIVWTDFSGNIG